ncbi:MAG TPA: hypothetical protein VKD90_24245 [Gemmataceae bacterium]|nr:hypothetical protein [Gemmataceae bacterium]
MEPEFSPAVAALMKVGRPENPDWRKYSALGITAEHIPEIRRILLSPEYDLLPPELPEVYAKIHAWRALAELGAPEVVPLLLERFDETTTDEDFDDWLTDDFSRVAARIGPMALDPLIEYLNDPSKRGDNRMSVAHAIAAVGRDHPDARPRALDVLVSCLQKWSENPVDLNTGLVSGLMDLRAQEAMPLIREAMEDGAVDEFFVGSVADVEYELGLRDRPPPPRRSNLPDPIDLARPSSVDLRQKRNAKDRARARRKQAKAAKRRNRSK